MYIAPLMQQKRFYRAVNAINPLPFIQKTEENAYFLLPVAHQTSLSYVRTYVYTCIYRI